MGARRSQGPVRLTVRQEQYCNRAIGINRFCYNLPVATHRFHRTNRLRWPSWQDIYQAFNACKQEDYPFVTEVSYRVAEGAFMDFGKAIDPRTEPLRQRTGPAPKTCVPARTRGKTRPNHPSSTPRPGRAPKPALREPDAIPRDLQPWSLPGRSATTRPGERPEQA